MRRFFGRRRQREEDLNDEVAFDLAAETEERVRGGMAREEAERESRRDLGSVLRIKETVRENWRWTRIFMLGETFRDAAHSLRANPGILILATVTLAFGIGLSSAALSILDAVVLQPLPYPQADRLVFLSGSALTTDNVSRWQSLTASFDKVAAVDPGLADVDTANGPEQLRSIVVSADFFPLLGVKASAGGRVLVESDYASGGVVMISGRLAAQLFGVRSAALEQSLHLVGTGYVNENFEVVGVYDDLGPLPYDDVDFILPLLPMLRPEGAPAIARLRPGVTIGMARAEAAALASVLNAEAPPRHGSRTAAVEPLKDQILGSSQVMVRLIFVSALLVLLISCGNVIHLILARSAGLANDIAIRMALGATRARLGAAILFETFLLTAVSAALGLLISNWTVRALILWMPYRVPRLAEAHTGVIVLAFTSFAALIIAIAFTAAALAQTSVLNLSSALKQGLRQTAGAGRNRFRTVLVTTELAIACVVIVLAGQLLQTYLILRPDNPGFNPANKLMLRVGNTRANAAASIPLSAQLQSSIAGLPGARGVAVSTDLPMTGITWTPDVEIGGQTVAGGLSEGAINFRSVSANYFSLMENPLVQGRGFDGVDFATRQPVAIVNQETARRFFGKGNAVGEKVKLVSGGPELPDLTIIGVARSTRIFSNVADARPEVFIPFVLAPERGFWLVVSSDIDPASLAGPLRQAVHRAAPQAVVHDMKTMDQLLAESVSRPRFNAFLLTSLGSLAAVLALAGIYAMLSFFVVQSRHEIGVRMAVGADTRDVLSLVLRKALRMAIIGGFAGAAAAWSLSPLMAGLVCGVAPADLRAYIASPIALLALAMAAAYLPARRAAAIDPMTILQNH